MKLIDALTIAAILLSPLIAIQVSAYLERRKSRRARKEEVFRNLMSTRRIRLSSQHVQALNMIDVEFYGPRPKDKAVVAAWIAYLDHLNNAERREKSIEVWLARVDDLFIELIYTMAICLGYDLNKTAIKNASYQPQAHGTIEEEFNVIRSGVATLVKQLEKGTPLPPSPPTPTQEEIDQRAREKEQQAEMQKLLKDYLSGDVPLKVVVIRDDQGLISPEPPKGSSQ